MPDPALLGRDDPTGAGAGAGDLVAEQPDRAGVGVLEPGDEAQQRRLAAPRRSQQGEELAGRDVEVDAFDGPHRAVDFSTPRSSMAATLTAPSARCGAR